MRARGSTVATLVGSSLAITGIAYFLISGQGLPFTSKTREPPALVEPETEVTASRPGPEATTEVPVCPSVPAPGGGDSARSGAGGGSGGEIVRVPSSRVELSYEATATSGGLWIQLVGESEPFEVVAIGVAQLSEFGPPDPMAMKKAARTIHSRSEQGRAFVPYLGSERICVRVRAGERQGSFEGLESAVPPAPPLSTRVALPSTLEMGGVHGLVRYQDGSPAGGVILRASPGGSSSWEEPEDVHALFDLCASQGTEVVTEADS